MEPYLVYLECAKYLNLIFLVQETNYFEVVRYIIHMYYHYSWKSFNKFNIRELIGKSPPLYGNRILEKYSNIRVYHMAWYYLSAV